MERTQEPEDAWLAPLERFLSGEGRGRAPSFRQLHGFLFAVACVPVEVPFHHIVQQALYDIPRGPLRRRARSDDVLRPFFALYRETCRQVDALDIDLPAVCAFRPRPLDNLEPGAPVSEWVTIA